MLLIKQFPLYKIADLKDESLDYSTLAKVNLMSPLLEQELHYKYVSDMFDSTIS